MKQQDIQAHSLNGDNGPPATDHRLPGLPCILLCFSGCILLRLLSPPLPPLQSSYVKQCTPTERVIIQMFYAACDCRVSEWDVLMLGKLAGCNPQSSSSPSVTRTLLPRCLVFTRGPGEPASNTYDYMFMNSVFDIPKLFEIQLNCHCGCCPIGNTLEQFC